MNGLTSGAFYVLMALGFTLIFGILRLVNFAHGEFYMLGAFVVYHLTTQLGLDYFSAVALSALVIGLAGMMVEKTVFAPLRGRELSMLMSALGLQIAIQGVMAVVEGVDGFSIPSPVSGVYRSSWLAFPYERLLVVGLTIVVLAGFYLLIKHSTLGKSLRAVAQDGEAALMQGIPVNRVYAIAFGLGAALAAIAGGLIAPIFSLHVYMGQAALLKAFIVVILGGLGSIPGAVVGGLLLGVAESAFATLFGGLTAEMLGFLLIMGVLLWKPTGILARADG
ncbi:MAG: branched-chain amino acid ABC transporter permease [Xanthobacteraceae bacterium]|nr:branched-chain amino acid ABC transporter permease [Xanthobacteraceae bacterium]PWB64546.1 MAG: branched-chain amino acid ABC transporter permease [Bradyrhizobiaceae bacterium]